MLFVILKSDNVGRIVSAAARGACPADGDNVGGLAGYALRVVNLPQYLKALCVVVDFT